MKKWIFIISFIGNFLLDMADTNAQQWIRIFTGDTNFMGDRIIEYYDKGYLIAGDKETSPIYFDGWLCKTDINGYRLWDKSFQESDTLVKIT